MIPDGVSTFYEALLSELSRSDEKTLPAGTRLFGHAPEIAPQAYLHALFPPLTANGFSKLEAQLHRPLPASLGAFYRLHNGCRFFMTNVCVFGFRYHYDRTDIISAVEQPFDLSTFLAGRQSRVAADHFPFAKYGDHDSENYRIGTIAPDGSVKTWNNRAIVSTHHDIYEYIWTEFNLAKRSMN